MGIIKFFKGCYKRRLVDSILIKIGNKVEEPFKVVRKRMTVLLGVGGKLRKKTIRNCWGKVDLCSMEDKQTDNDENPKNGDISDAQECVLSLQQSLIQLEEKSGKMSGINVEEYLTADDNLLVFAGVTEEDILSEITDEMENDVDDTDTS
ncbi:hypothetical protein AVEN_72665-1 [Araneus ventricosus]|uniref:Uncharacterized protein n=1 Tax=Araneus ventricosus TaxID=182803 RepID=A0A4Y2L4Q7_ARAVE|nr:hypothetical protein AVEN_72665-1 [Araneus ventricosus]